MAQAALASEGIEAASRELADAEHELGLWVTNPTLLTILGDWLFVTGAEARQNAIDKARERVTRLRQHSSLVSELADADIVGAWPTLTMAEKRRLLHGLLDRVVLTRADRRGRHGTP